MIVQLFAMCACILLFIVLFVCMFIAKRVKTSSRDFSFDSTELSRQQQNCICIVQIHDGHSEVVVGVLHALLEIEPDVHIIIYQSNLLVNCLPLFVKQHKNAHIEINNYIPRQIQRCRCVIFTTATDFKPSFLSKDQRYVRIGHTSKQKHISEMGLSKKVHKNFATLTPHWDQVKQHNDNSYVIVVVGLPSNKYKMNKNVAGVLDLIQTGTRVTVISRERIKYLPKVANLIHFVQMPQAELVKYLTTNNCILWTAYDQGSEYHKTTMTGTIPLAISCKVPLIMDAFEHRFYKDLPALVYKNSIFEVISEIPNHLSTLPNYEKFVSKQIMNFRDILSQNGIELGIQKKQIIVWSHALSYFALKKGWDIYQHEFNQNPVQVNTSNTNTILVNRSDRTFPQDYSKSEQKFILKFETIGVQNIDRTKLTTTHFSKTIPIPIGLDLHANHIKSIFGIKKKPWYKQLDQLYRLRNKNVPRMSKVLVTWTKNNNSSKRHVKNGYKSRPQLWREAMSNPDVFELGTGNRDHTWKMMSEYAFVYSPIGNGFDCHRTWEALALGCIVIAQPNPTIKEFVDRYPIILHNNPAKITQQDLQRWLHTYKPAKLQDLTIGTFLK